jgi:hypothetical protein
MTSGSDNFAGMFGLSLIISGVSTGPDIAGKLGVQGKTASSGD